MRRRWMVARGAVTLDPAAAGMTSAAAPITTPITTAIHTADPAALDVGDTVYLSTEHDEALADGANPFDPVSATSKSGDHATDIQERRAQA
ncbi:hypothetical protein ACIHCQ_26795 [Streptomyces sp. NPDC052236]|uniref:hypothetical protein n=1 Tax=Streptomyces sp. NPDC052236 TaxID=3365686 RepID=UPI0037D8402A